MKYSVLMSLYIKENPNWFVKSVNSMLKQTVQPDEIIIVLDGPLTEELNQKVKDFYHKNPEIFTIIPLKENVGLGQALNVGIKESRNDLIARMDTDDISLPSRCEKQLICFKNNPKLDLVGTQINEFVDDTEKIISSRTVPTSYEDIKKFAKRRSPFNHPTVMYKKSMLIDVGGYGSSRRKEDLDLFSRIVNEGYFCKNLPEPLLLYRSDENNLKRRTSWSNVKDYIDAQIVIWKRGHCSFADLIYVITAQIFMYIAPVSVVEKVSKKYLRSEPIEIKED